MSVSLPPPPLSVLPAGAAVIVSAKAEPLAVSKPPIACRAVARCRAGAEVDVDAVRGARERDGRAARAAAVEDVVAGVALQQLPKTAGAVTFWKPVSVSLPPSPSLAAVPARRSTLTASAAEP